MKDLTKVEELYSNDPNESVISLSFEDSQKIASEQNVGCVDNA